MVRYKYAPAAALCCSKNSTTILALTNVIKISKLQDRKPKWHNRKKGWSFSVDTNTTTASTQHSSNESCCWVVYPACLELPNLLAHSYMLLSACQIYVGTTYLLLCFEFSTNSIYETISADVLHSKAELPVYLVNSPLLHYCGQREAQCLTSGWFSIAHAKTAKRHIINIAKGQESRTKPDRWTILWTSNNLSCGILCNGKLSLLRSMYALALVSTQRGGNGLLLRGTVCRTITLTIFHSEAVEVSLQFSVRKPCPCHLSIHDHRRSWRDLKVQRNYALVYSIIHDICRPITPYAFGMSSTEDKQVPILPR